MTDDAAPGWDAIDARLDQLYPGVEPQHYGTLLRFRLGGDDPLDGISFYPRDGHWHVVGYGLSELYAKESDHPDESGWGFELTSRVARPAGETEPPLWAANLMQNIARYVFGSGNPIEPGDHMNANGPIRQDHPTDLTALAFVEDPELGAIDTPHGRLRFLQLVGLTTGEYEAVRRWSTDGVLGLLRDRDPLLITDLDRPSLTADPAARAAIDAGQAREGSSTGQLLIAGFTATPADGEVRLHFQPITTALVAGVLRDRLPHGRDLILDGEDTRVVLRDGPSYATRQPAEGLIELTLPPPVVTAFAAALVAGVHPVTGAPGLTVEVSG
jgi:suppressor of fused-like protein